MASGKKNYFRHSFSARNDEFIMGLMKEFKEKGYYMWFALCEISGEMLADGHSFPLKFNQSRLYKELRCNHSTLNLFLTYCESRLKVHSTYVEPTFNLEIPSLLKYIGKYSEISPNKRKEKEIKEKKSKVRESEPSVPAPPTKIISPLLHLFEDRPDIQEWLNTGLVSVQGKLLSDYSDECLLKEISKAYEWNVEKRKKRGAGTFLSNWFENGKKLEFRNGLTPRQKAAEDELYALLSGQESA